MSNDGHFFLLDVSSQLFNKLMIITSFNMIKNGWGNSRGDNSVSTQNQRCHQLFLFTRDFTFLLGICTCI